MAATTIRKKRSSSATSPAAIKKLICPLDRHNTYHCLSRELHLYVRVTRAGNKSLVYHRKMNGVYRDKTLEGFRDDVSEATLREVISNARKAALAIEEAIESGSNPFDEAAAEKAEPTLQQLFDAYMQRHIVKTGKRSGDIRKNFDRWLGKMASRKASTITRHDAEKLHGDLAKQRGEYAANRAIQLARAVYNKGRQWKLYFHDNPFSCLTLFDEQPRNRFLSSEEAGKLFKALQVAPERNDAIRTLRDFVLLDMLTGVRKSNLLSCRWDEIDLKTGTWTIPPEKSKNKSGQVIPLGGNELVILKARQQLLKDDNVISPFVFPCSKIRASESGHLTDLKNSWTTLRARLGLLDITIHDLRRSLAATMASQNVNVALIKGALNHKDLKTTLHVYARTNKKAELEAKQLAHAVWFKEAGLLSDDDVKPAEVVPIKEPKRKTAADNKGTKARRPKKG